jgi:hypothetical protein
MDRVLNGKRWAFKIRKFWLCANCCQPLPELDIWC